MRFGLRFLVAFVLSASAAAAAFAAAPASAAAGAGAVQDALAPARASGPAGPAGEQTVPAVVAPTARAHGADAKTGHQVPDGARARIGRPPVTPSVSPGTPPPNAFFTVAPCRVFDTRLAADAPALQTGVARTIQITGHCGIPTSAKM